MLTAALPSGVLGPVDFCALRRLASNCLSVAISFLTNKAKFGASKEGTQGCFATSIPTVAVVGRLQAWEVLISGVFSMWEIFCECVTGFSGHPDTRPGFPDSAG